MTKKKTKNRGALKRGMVALLDGKTTCLVIKVRVNFVGVVDRRAKTDFVERSCLTPTGDRARRVGKIGCTELLVWEDRLVGVTTYGSLSFIASPARTLKLFRSVGDALGYDVE